LIAKELQRAGQTGANIEELSHKLGFSRADDLYIAAARGEMNLRQFQLGGARWRPARRNAIAGRSAGQTKQAGRR
jgi:hypothetical protein